MLAVVVLRVVPAAANPPTTFNPVVEAENFSITQQRQTIYDTPSSQAQLAIDSANSTAQALATEAADPGRFFTDDLCWNLSNGCAGDIRLNNWASNGYGIVRPVLVHQVGDPQRQAIEHHQVGATGERRERGDNLQRLFDSLKISGPRRAMKLDARRHFVVERLSGRDEEFALIRERELQRLHALAAASAAGD